MPASLAMTVEVRPRRSADRAVACRRRPSQADRDRRSGSGTGSDAPPRPGTRSGSSCRRVYPSAATAQDCASALLVHVIVGIEERGRKPAGTCREETPATEDGDEPVIG